MSQFKLGSLVASFGLAPYGGVWVRSFSDCPACICHGSAGLHLKWGEAMFSERTGLEKPLFKLGRVRLFRMKATPCLLRSGITSESSQTTHSETKSQETP